ncbi:hypothetical protein [uncultured Fibrobacter sp.]|uniref:hypothetical protein n=1 Tax=uncultured Fibrobacter sp. TaxID=261512 RepID=UPI00261C15A3|nr:hypothetical protein [uncultured Fibrobacter sp.]
MARGILWIILAVCTLLLVGCSVAIIRPPSAASFMEKSEDAFVKDISASAYWGDLTLVEEHVAKGVKTLEHSDEWYKDHYYATREEWPFDFKFSLQKSMGYFKYGFGFDFVTPYVQAGLVTDYFGVMGWSNLWVWQLEKVEHKYFQWGGGISLIEQLPIGDNFRIGLTQHLSRNGREAMAIEESASMLNVGPSAPIFYDEMGCGTYISFIPYYVTRVSLEFRYGRDLTYKRGYYSYNPEKQEKISDVDRYSLTISFFGW